MNLANPDQQLRGGEVRIAPHADYEPGAKGWVIEQADYWNGSDHPTWALPAWDERGEPHLAGVFDTSAAARRALEA